MYSSPSTTNMMLPVRLSSAKVIISSSPMNASLTSKIIDGLNFSTSNTVVFTVELNKLFI